MQIRFFVLALTLGGLCSSSFAQSPGGDIESGMALLDLGRAIEGFKTTQVRVVELREIAYAPRAYVDESGNVLALGTFLRASTVFVHIKQLNGQPAMIRRNKLSRIDDSYVELCVSAQESESANDNGFLALKTAQEALEKLAVRNGKRFESEIRKSLFPTPGKTDASDEDGKPTFANYLRVNVGMSRRDLNRLLGPPTTSSESQLGVAFTEVQTWPFVDKVGACSITVRGGRVAGKQHMLFGKDPISAN